MKVLIADDSALLRSQLIELLCELDEIVIVGQAQDAQETLRLIRALRPDVITLDLQLCGGSSLDALKEIKQDALVPVVIMLTNHALPPYREKCLQAGADFFFDKATEFAAVKQAIQDLLVRFKMNEAAAQ